MLSQMLGFHKDEEYNLQGYEDIETWLNNIKCITRNVKKVAKTEDEFVRVCKSEYFVPVSYEEAFIKIYWKG